MAFSVEMPELGESVTEGTITQWLKSVGDTVEADEPLLEVSTDKVDTEVPSPASGVLLEIKAEEDDTVDVGSVIAVIGDADEASADAPAESAPPQDAPQESREEPTATQQTASEATDVAMPELGESVTEGTITQWLKSVGDTVEADEPLLEVSTDKVDTEVPSPVAGTLLEILAEEDDTVDVGATIARIGDKDAAPAEPKKDDPQPTEQVSSAKPTPEETSAPEAQPEEKKEKDEDTTSSTTSGAFPYVTPLVRKLAEKHSVDLSTVTGTGVGGRVRKQDVLAAAEGGSTPESDAQSPEKSPAPKAPGTASMKSVDPQKAKLRGTVQKANRIRQITATKTVEALQTSAQLTQVQEVDMTKVAQLRKTHKPAFAEKHGANLTYLPFFAKAVVEALVSHPNVNASYNAETKEITYHESVNLSIAVDTPAGLLTPVIHNAQDKTLPELAQAIAELADRARNNKLKPNDLVGGTFTITNIGSEGALTDTPILVPPQAGILGTGVITKRPVVVTRDGLDAIAIRQMVFLPLTYDHQLVDGADAGRFLTTIKDRLETADFESDLLL
ncbi:2-oxoglutarate dehydrogenase, E2 component, dihydrolipoamide succinyltransferase [Corynebacterium sp. zg-331]|uniref:2-oxoglutarate dehydrogenase, E2 component, dihydrolipoamide succinyltransferase n=1 Tax=unclassified Corynebacterium TaxID=2624378 RepID=UPI00128BA9E0|nr:MULTISPECIES: 2-oxoglutarate dehydrogenase, E2 component, dihydrolipoamide succinyltransferase [unclassified Corynebacterium]MBC3185183.1 2-oxoglutarate dehydrogenase, E2 component, dihydrolipoamide succinyltransferase [Corynebacterium sp. zg-331]MPV51681.1 2-oxoglutarate dehydrogenase, E2 component, dihydrolipoamide succinyltransferase [Corynebacterium sp. zg331]